MKKKNQSFVKPQTGLMQNKQSDMICKRLSYDPPRTVHITYCGPHAEAKAICAPMRTIYNITYLHAYTHNCTHTILPPVDIGLKFFKLYSSFLMNGKCMNETHKYIMACDKEKNVLIGCGFEQEQHFGDI